MSEEILKSLTQLLAIVASQDNIITESERNYVINLLGQDLDPESLNRYIEEFDQLTSNLRQIPGREKEDPFRQLSVKETVQTLAVCNKINRTLEQKQKILLLIKILQLIAVDSNFTLQKQKIIETISAVFNITERELEVIKAFVFHRPGMPVNFEEILLVSRNLDPSHAKETKHIQAELEGEIIFSQTHEREHVFCEIPRQGRDYP